MEELIEQAIKEISRGRADRAKETLEGLLKDLQKNPPAEQGKDDAAPEVPSKEETEE